MFDVRNSSPQLRRAVEAGLRVAIVPIASIEQHGPHLPVGTDWIIGSEVARRVAQRVGGFLLPTLPFGTAQEHGPSWGTVWLRQGTLFAVVQDVLTALEAQGFRRAVVLTSHGGNWVIKPAVREFNLNHQKLRALWVAPYDLAAARLAEVLQAPPGVHADEAETSLMLYLDPSAVCMEQAVDFVPDVGREFLDYARIFEIAPHGVWGKPSLASAPKGEQILQILVDETVAYVNRSFASLERLANPGQQAESQQGCAPATPATPERRRRKGGGEPE